jgi:TolB-like protein/DNA-binding SARP family transcriptional activator/Tfp pilus assembly protein PilF
VVSQWPWLFSGVEANKLAGNSRGPILDAGRRASVVAASRRRRAALPVPTMHRLLLFGGALLDAPEGPVAGRAVQPRRLALLALLAVEHPRGLGREKLVAYLWPECDAERGRHLLRDSLYLLRTAVGDAVLSVSNELRLDPERLQCDLWEFRAALAAGDLEAALALYRGPFLDGLFVDDAAEFERWAEVERSRLALSYREALEALAEQKLASGDTRAAAGAWRGLAEQDPYNSHVVLRLMQALAATGDRAGALRHAAEHTALLQAEFGAEPDADVEALAIRLREISGPRAAEPESGGAEEQTRRGDPPWSPAGAGRLPGTDGSGTSSPLTPAAEAAAGTARSPPAQAPTAVQSAKADFVPLLQRIHSPGWGGLLVAGTLVLAVLGALASGERGERMLGALGIDARTLLPGWSRGTAGEPLVERSLAVLPFADLSADGDSEYFSDGLTEEVVATLARIDELQVISRTSTLRYKATEQSLPEIARELGVRYILEGSVRRSGERLRITVQLIDARSDAHLWAGSYDRELSAGTLFRIQSDIARQIASVLRAEISPAEVPRIERQPTSDLVAYDLYLRGRESRRSYTAEAFRHAIAHFDDALALDPRFALAEAYRGDSFGELWVRTGREEYRDSASAASQRALRLDPELPEAHQQMGRLHASFGRLAEALRQILRALELDPNHPGALQDAATIYRAWGRFDLALPLAKRAAALEPTSGEHRLAVAWIYTYLEEFEEARHWIEEAFRLEPAPMREHVISIELSLRRGQLQQTTQHLVALRHLVGDMPLFQLFLAEVALYTGDEDAARRNYERPGAVVPYAIPHVPGQDFTGLAYLYWKAGERRGARGVLDEDIARARRKLEEGSTFFSPHLTLARAYAVQGEVDRALEGLEAAYGHGWRDHSLAQLDPRFESLHGHPRYERLMAVIRSDLERMRTRVREMESQ